MNDPIPSWSNSDSDPDPNSNPNSNPNSEEDNSDLSMSMMPANRDMFTNEREEDNNDSLDGGRGADEDSTIEESEEMNPSTDSGVPRPTGLGPYGEAGVNQVACGMESCNLESQTCCVTEFGAQCIEGTDQNCPAGVPQICDGPEECGAGQFCCLTVNLPGEYICSSSPCVNTAVCHTDDDCDIDKICRLCTFPNTQIAVCARPNFVPSIALSCE